MVKVSKLVIIMHHNYVRMYVCMNVHISSLRRNVIEACQGRYY